MYKKLLYIILFSIFLRPHFSFLSGFYATFMFDILIILLIFIFMILILFKKVDNIWLEIFPFLFSIIFLLMIPVLLNVFLDYYPIKSLINIFILIYYILVYYILVYLIKNIDQPFVFVKQFLDFTFLFIFIIAIIQLINPPFLGNFINLVYGTVKLRTLWSGYPRVYSTFYNANWFGVYLVFYSLGIFISYSHNFIKWKEFIIKVFMLVILFILSGSRTSVLGLLGGLVFNLLINLKASKLIYSTMFFSLVVLFINFLNDKITFISKTLDRFFFLFNNFRYIFIDPSFLAEGRFLSWMKAYKLFLEEPVFGYGDNSVAGVPHNSYLTILLNYGLFGFFVILIGVFLIYIYLKNKHVGSNYYKAINNWFKDFIISFGIIAFAGDYINSSQVMLVFVFLFALWSVSGDMNYKINLED